MDPLTHVVIGRAVVAAAREPHRNHAIGSAAILGALSPDIDGAIALTGWDRYVRAHQFGTHSLVGALAMAWVTAFVVGRSARAERFAALVCAAAAGALSHVALDLMSGARIAILWPFVDRRVSLPLVAMADPWVIGICIAWLLLLWPARIPLRRASQVVIAATVVFLCFKAAMLGMALRQLDGTRHEPSALDARWGSLTGWFVFERRPDRVSASVIASRGGPPTFVMTRPLASDTPFVRASRSLDDVQNFLAVHEFAFPAETAAGGGRVSVMWSDLRYCSPTRCDVWVGGTFDANGRPIAQEVRVGSVVQQRHN
ncbi:MAG TPA: metal-dependent hydrolase [Vicinamibacterales bacterium]|nr:metal-dependent hydrolase [Vicinamibacterales bacterium]